jgi:hypothetical protein
MSMNQIGCLQSLMAWNGCRDRLNDILEVKERADTQFIANVKDFTLKLSQITDTSLLFVSTAYDFSYLVVIMLFLHLLLFIIC